MAIRKLDDLVPETGPAGRLMGLDLGTTTIGLAVSDASQRVASPIGTIRRRKFTPDAAALFAEMDQRDVRALVVGLPVNMDGSEGPRAQSVRDFARNLLTLRPNIEIAFWDERLSTVAVERAMIREADLSRAKRARAVDAAAAAFILQGALDYLRGRPRPATAPAPQ